MAGAHAALDGQRSIEATEHWLHRLQVLPRQRQAGHRREVVVELLLRVGKPRPYENQTAHASLTSKKIQRHGQLHSPYENQWYEQINLTSKGFIAGMHLGIVTCELKPTHGWARYSLDLLMALHRAGIQLTVATSGSSPTDYPFPVYPILPEAVPAPRLLPPRLGLAIPRTWVALRGADLIHTLIEPFSHLGAVVAGNRPHLISAHGTYAALPTLAHPISRPLYTRAFRRAANIICTSRYTQSVLLKSVPQARSTVIPNAVDAADFAIRVQAAQPFEKTGTIILTVGAVKPRKGVLEFIRAFSTVHQSQSGSRCVVVGSLSGTAYANTLREEIARLGLENHVTLTGRVSDSDLMRWYRTADIFALPAMNDGPRFEGFGLVYLEASAAGLPVIGTRDCGAQEAIIDGQTGLLVNQIGVVDELATALRQLLDSPALRAKLGENGRAHASTQTWKRAAKAFITAYEQALRSRRA